MKVSRKGQGLRKNRMALDQRYRTFAEAYMDIGKPTFQRVVASAIAAGYSESYARGLAYKLLDNIGVQKWIERIREDRRRHDVCTAEEILEALSDVVRGNPKDLVDSEGNFVPLDELDDSVARSLVAGMKQKTRKIPNGENVITEHTIEYKLLDRLKAAQLLADHHGLLGDPNKRSKLVKETKTLLVGYPVDPMPLAEWERQVRELMGYNQPVEIPGLPAPE